MRARDLEQALSRLLPLKHFILTGYARNGIYLLIKALEWGREAEIIIPAFTCPIIPTALHACGVHPVPVDVEEGGLNIDPELIAKAITPRTKAIYVVHTYGNAAKIERICALAREHGLMVIEDLAHALFATLQGKPLGTFGDVAVLSFTKKVINFEGGAIGTNNTDINDKIRILQQKYQQSRPVTLGDLRDWYVRLVGSWWESRFSLVSLMLMKGNDIFNDLIFKGGYGLSVDPGKFIMHPFAQRLTRWQLGALYAKNCNAQYLRFKDSFQHDITIANHHQGTDDSLPAYYSGIPKNKRRVFSMLSFRTWHDWINSGHFPRATQLYADYRIFSRSILRLPHAAIRNL